MEGNDQQTIEFLLTLKFGDHDIEKLRQLQVELDLTHLRDLLRMGTIIFFMITDEVRDGARIASVKDDAWKQFILPFGPKADSKIPQLELIGEQQTPGLRVIPGGNRSIRARRRHTRTKKRRL